MSFKGTPHESDSWLRVFSELSTSLPARLKVNSSRPFAFLPSSLARERFGMLAYITHCRETITKMLWEKEVKKLVLLNDNLGFITQASLGRANTYRGHFEISMLIETLRSFKCPFEFRWQSRVRPPAILADYYSKAQNITLSPYFRRKLLSIWHLKPLHQPLSKLQLAFLNPIDKVALPNVPERTLLFFPDLNLGPVQYNRIVLFLRNRRIKGLLIVPSFRDQIFYHSLRGFPVFVAQINRTFFIADFLNLHNDYHQV